MLNINFNFNIQLYTFMGTPPRSQLVRTVQLCYSYYSYYARLSAAPGEERSAVVGAGTRGAQGRLPRL